MDQKQIQDKLERIQREVNQVIRGKENVVERVLAAIISGGHILMEDIPGVGKTTLATTFAKALSMNYKRVQFTPDVLPSDILGFSMYDAGSRQFVYRPGAVFCNLFLADEINRTSPKTQSALLEVMEEGCVTVDGVTREMPEPFLVMATQNPKGSAGTQLLPESQLDRFMICVSMGYPDVATEIEIARGKSASEGQETISPVIDAAGLCELQRVAGEVFVQDEIYNYIVQLVTATRNNQYIDLGLSPRGTIACTKIAKAWAFLQGRDYVLPEDVEEVFPDVARHRIVLNTRSRAAHVTELQVIAQILKEVPQPTAQK